MKKNIALYGLPVAVLLLIYFPLFTANFAYLDDVFLLWHKDRNFNIWLVDGRCLSAFLMEKAYNSFHGIDDVKMTRIVSLLGWMLACCVFVKFLLQWIRYNVLDERLGWLGGICLACSISLVVYTGWGGSCFEVFIAFLCGLTSGHLLYTQLKKKNRFIAIPVPLLLLITVLGIASLFFYQIGLGAFLIPFFLQFATNEKLEKPGSMLITAVTVYLLMHVIYFFLFKYTLHIAGAAGDERATLSFNIPGKISFFVGVPTAQAFSFNFLFNLHSILSQIFYIAVIVVWLVNIFVTRRNIPVGQKLLHVFVIIALQMLIYLPVLASGQNFPSYRTMVNLNLAVSLMLMHMILGWIRNNTWKNRFVVTAIIILIVTGFYNFRYNFLKPLAKEHEVVKAYIQQQYRPGITKVYFLRPPENLFYNEFHIHVYRDELGQPSTFRDWVPEPLTKQLIYEITNNRQIAEKTEVVQFDNRDAFNKQAASGEKNALFVDVETIYNK